MVSALVKATVGGLTPVVAKNSLSVFSYCLVSLVFCLCFICLGPPSSLACCASWFWSSCYIHNAKDLEKKRKKKKSPSMFLSYLSNLIYMNVRPSK